MASFPDLRPNRCSAMTERWVARSFRQFALLLAGIPAALPVVAFIADPELATLRGAKASVRTPVFLTLVNGSSGPAVSPVRKAAPGPADLLGALA